MSFTIRKVKEKKEPSRLRKKLMSALPMVLSGLKMLRQYMPKSEGTEEETAPQNRTGRLKKVWTTLVVILIVLLILIGSMRVLLRIKELAFGAASIAGAELPVDENGFTNVLLLGVGDKDHDGVDLTDSVIVASIDAKKTKSVFLLSLPRDLYALSTEKMGAARINSLYRDYKGALMYKGMKSAEASDEAIKQLGIEVGTLLGLPIHGTIKVTFSGFTEAVDLLGGVDLVVPYDIVDTEYPGPNYSYETFSIKAGQQHLDGEAALKYARSRHTTSDFSRSARQQQLLSALSAKATEEGILKRPKKVMDMLSILARNIESTFTVRELVSFTTLAKSIDTTRITGMQLNDQNGLFSSLVGQGGFLYSPPREEFEGASVLLPVSIPEYPVTWKQIQTFTTLITNNREILYAPTRIAVLNAGAKEGAARLLGGELSRYGFNVIRIGNYGPSGTPDTAQSFIDTRAFTDADPSDSSSRATAHAKLLTDILSIGSGDALPESFTDDGETADLILVLGEEYRFVPLQDLLSE